MIRYSAKWLLTVVALLLFGCSESFLTSSSAQLEKGFITPPDSVRISTYWYWISGNISKEGVVKDLQAMKEAGITRAYIGNIGHEDVPTGPVKLMSKEWWEILHTALKTATALDIEIGIFNSPGWSQSGGPWVKPEESMRYLTTAQTRVTGPTQVNKKLPVPPGMIQDVRVIAYPEPKDNHLMLNSSNGIVRANPAIPSVEQLADGDTLTHVTLPDHVVLEFETTQPFTARSLTLRPEHRPMAATATLEALGETGYRTVKEFTVSRYNEMRSVGFDTYAPVTISFPATTAQKFRLTLHNTHVGSALREVELCAAPRLERYSEKSLAKMHQTPLPYWKDYLWPPVAENDDPRMMIDPQKVIDLSAQMMPDGTLVWDAPEGNWIILRTGMASTGVTNSPATPEATGLEIDKMSKKHVRTHFDAFIGQILQRIPAEDRRSFQVVVQDSYETGGQNFTDDFFNQFTKKYGYDPLPFLPVFEGAVVQSTEASDRFLWDVRRLVADAVSYDYVGGMREVCHEHGLTTWLENYGHWGFPGEFLQYGGQSDEVAGEFWSEGELGDIENRAASSCAHIYGKQKVYAESFTCAGAAFSRYPANMKQRCDRFFAEGINATLLTLFISQLEDGRLPGVNAAYGNEFNRNNTWYPQVGTFVTYLKRCNFMLQQGLNVADVAYFIGEDAPKMTGVTDPPLPQGYQFDYINGEVLLHHAMVRDGLLTLPHGTQYRLLVLPQLETIRPELLGKIATLVRQGAVILGPKPQRSPSLQNQPAADRQVQRLAQEMWGDTDGATVKSNTYGKGEVLLGMTIEEAMSHINCLPDMQTNQKEIHYGHRKVGNTDLYFVSNQAGERVAFTAAFRIAGLQPECWEPTSGKIRNMKQFESTAQTTLVPLQLEPFESVFMVFRTPTNAFRHGENYPTPITLAQVTTPWQVTFDSLRRAPSKPLVWDHLIDWRESDLEQIRFYSGTALYRNTFTLPETETPGPIYLDLGRVSAMALVRINGQDAGGVWTPPYRIEVTDLLYTGENQLEIEVVNTWVNRLIGDSYLPVDQRPTWSPHNPWTPTSPLQESGLLGPVQLITNLQ